MLHYQSIDSTALELLKKLMAIPQFNELFLVGGTSLALQIGHRKSIDLEEVKSKIVKETRSLIN